MTLVKSTRTSIRRAPVRDVGLSEARLAELPERERVALFLICGVFALVTLTELASSLFHGPRLVAAWVLGCVVTIGYAFFHLRAVKSAAHELERDVADEHVLQAQLAGLAVTGARVFTHVPAGRRTIDLVILSQHGAFACDLKMATHADSRTPLRISVDAQKFRVDGVVLTPNPARWITEDVELLQQVMRVGRNDDIIVRPLIVIGGAPIELEKQKGAPDVEIVSALALDKVLKGNPETLSIVELTMHAVRLAAHVREARSR
jgi:hypothetical protein